MLPLIECAFKEDGEIQKIINDQKTRYEKKKKTSKKSHGNIKSQNLRKRYIFFVVLRNVWFFIKFFILKSILKKCDMYLIDNVRQINGFFLKLFHSKSI